MSDANRLALLLTTNILGAGLAVIFCFGQLSEYLNDHRLRHIAAALAWFALAILAIFRTAGTMKPPLLDPQIIMDGAAITWALFLVFGMMWAVLRIFEQRNEAAARRRLGLDTKDERENE